MNSKTKHSKSLSQAEYYLDQAHLYYEEAEELEVALSACEAALELEPDSADAHNLRGVILEELGRKQEARQAYRQALRLDPDLFEAKANLAYLDAELTAPSRLTTIARFSYPTEAYIPKTKLESAGIPAFVADEYIVTMNWLFSNAIGGVKLQVRDADVDQALKILNNSGSSLDAWEDAWEDEDSELDDEPQCPNCGSPNIKYESYNMTLIFATWLASAILFAVLLGRAGGFSIPFMKRQWRCQACSYIWRVARGS